MTQLDKSYEAEWFIESDCIVSDVDGLEYDLSLLSNISPVLIVFYRGYD